MNLAKVSLVFLPVALLSLPAVAQNPYLEPDDTWISLSGTVESVSLDEFELNYGTGTVTVEMDDGDRDADAYKLAQGDEVTVSGMIDDDFYEMTTIEASSVYVDNLNTTFYASAMDEEDSFAIYPFNPPGINVAVGDTVIIGTISGIDVEGQRFTLNAGARLITVEVDQMPLNPLDDIGYQQLETGDVVSVGGQSDMDLFEGQVFEASNITKLWHDTP